MHQRLANMHCGGRGKLRLIQCVHRTVRNGAHLRRSSLDTVCRDNPPPRMLCLLERAASVRPHAYARGRVRVCVCVCACVGLHEPHHSTDNKTLSGPLEALTKWVADSPHIAIRNW